MYFLPVFIPKVYTLSSNWTSDKLIHDLFPSSPESRRVVWKGGKKKMVR